MKFSLAPFLYRNIHRAVGGPVSDIAVRTLNVFGVGAYEAYVTLDESFTGISKRDYKLYGSCHGTGTSQSRSLAVYKGISEAIERWAWEVSLNNPHHLETLRLDCDPSTTGFAAFPGIRGSSARSKAFSEAVERYAIANWWEGKLSHEVLNLQIEDACNGIKIDTPWTNRKCVVLWANTNAFTAYGFGCSVHLQESIFSAKVELTRNISVLKHYYGGNLETPDSLIEKRLLYFSTSFGNSKFLERVSFPKKSRVSPILIADTYVPGPWQRYASVWRCLYSPTDLSSSVGVDYFLF